MIGIKGMKMPENCSECPFPKADYDYDGFIEGYYCFDRWVKRIPSKGKFSFCPLIEIEGE